MAIQDQEPSAAPPAKEPEKLELGTLPETIGEADLDKLNLALGFLFGRLREARAGLGTNERLATCYALDAFWNFVALFRMPYANLCKCQSCACKMPSRALSRVVSIRCFSLSSAWGAPPQATFMPA